jgi:hypothetical protein
VRFRASLSWFYPDDQIEDHRASEDALKDLDTQDLANLCRRGSRIRQAMLAANLPDALHRGPIYAAIVSSIWISE